MAHLRRWASRRRARQTRAALCRLSDRYRSIREEALVVLQHARDRGAVRTDIPLDTAAALMIAALDGLSTQWLLDPDVDMQEGMALIEYLLAPAGLERSSPARPAPSPPSREAPRPPS